MHIFIDADACPVKSETLKVAERHGVAVKIVSNGGIRPSRDPMVEVVVVPAGADAADDWIADHCAPNDIVVTADIPLAARIIDRGATALGPNGNAFTEDGIGMALAMRDLKQHLRESTQSQTYNRSFTDRDRSNFLQELDKLVVKAKRATPTQDRNNAP